MLAAIVAVTLHELSRAVTGLLRGVHPTLYSNSVSFRPDDDPATQLVTAATGPLFSLVLGVIVLLPGRRVGRGFGRLLVLWLGLISIQVCAGYLMIAPLSRAGDTGKVLDLLGAPTLVFVVFVIVGVVGTLALSRTVAGQALRYTRGKAELFRLVMYPWLIGTAVVVVLSVADLSRTGAVTGDEFVLIVAAAVATGIFAPMFTLFWQRMKPGPAEELSLKRPVIPLLVTVVLAVVVFVVVAPGLPLG